MESLFADDSKTGSALYNDNLRWKADAIEKLDAELIIANTKREFINFLVRVSYEAETTELFPIIHLEIHGSDDKKGLILNSGEFTSWEEIKPELTRINVAVKNNLLVTLAVCHGAYLIFILRPTDRAPVWGLVGPVIKVNTQDVAISFNAFYDELLTSFNGDRAVKKLNETLEGEPYRYDFINCEFLFREVYQKHLSEDYTHDSLNKRAKRMARRLRNQPNWQGKSPKQIRRIVKNELLESRRPKFEEYQEKFFMYDLYPENRDRFIVPFEDVIAEND